MSLTNAVGKVQYSPGGSTTAFSTTFPFIANSHVVVVLRSADGVTQTTLAETTDYTLTGAGNAVGGTVTCLSAPASGSLLTIKRVVPITQLATYVANDAFPSATHEQALDLLTMVCQQLAENIARCIQYPADEAAGVNATLPQKTTRASKTLAFDSVGVITVI